jgi:hypothetical protein
MKLKSAVCAAFLIPTFGFAIAAGDPNLAKSSDKSKTEAGTSASRTESSRTAKETAKGARGDNKKDASDKAKSGDTLRK